MSALLDTCVVSEKYKANPEAAVMAAVAALGNNAYISVVTIGEMLKGAELLAEGREQRKLLAWLNKTQDDFGPRVLPIDLEIARLWGELTAHAQRQGRQVAAPDGLIAATARHHGLPVMTRNVGDFTPTGVQVVNPWPD